MATRTAEGPLLANRYRILKRLGSGGMAAVYLAQDERLGRRVAIKRLHASNDDETDVLRFEREAKIGASLSHPNLVSIFDTEQDEESVLLVMEYVEGETLADLLARGPVKPVRAAAIVRAVADALDHAHANGIVHRDIKPGNVLLGKDGSVKLADLGIAKAVERTEITGTGTVLGTPAYMAPEQLEGRGLAPAVDIYALATMAFEMLTGKKARSGRSAVEIAHQVVNEPPPDPRDLAPEIPAPVAHAIRAGMARNPEERPQSAAELADELERHLDETAERDVPTRRIEPLVAPAAVASPAPRTEEMEAPAPAAAGRSGGRGWVYATAALVAVAVAAVALGLSSGGGAGDGAPGSADSGAGAKEAKKEQKEKSQGRAAAPTPEEPQEASAPEESSGAVEPVAGGGAVPEPSGHGTVEEARALQRQGFDALNAGDYERAIELSRKSVVAFPQDTSDLQYAYALFNLGKALRLSGRPQEAVQVLEARLQIPNQQGTVRRELELAREAASD